MIKTDILDSMTKKERMSIHKLYKDCKVIFCPTCNNLLDQKKKCRVCDND